MANYLRAWIPGGTFFFTVVTHQRQPIFNHPLAREILRHAFLHIKQNRPFVIDAIVLLPDHLHCVWTLPTDDSDYATRWKQIKKQFTQRYLEAGFAESPISVGRQKQGDRGVWQRRYYEHMVRDERDLRRCVDYLHLNPVKHQLAERVQDWPWSSFHRHVKLGEYSNDWGGSSELYGDEWEQYE